VRRTVCAAVSRRRGTGSEGSSARAKRLLFRHYLLLRLLLRHLLRLRHGDGELVLILSSNISFRHCKHFYQHSSARRFLESSTSQLYKTNTNKSYSFPFFCDTTIEEAQGAFISGSKKLLYTRNRRPLVFTRERAFSSIFACGITTN
jgi:hypothetical protein